MMSRVLKTATALLAFMLMASVAVWAAPAVTAPTVSVDGATGNVTVSTQINDGGTPLSGKQVTMLTYKDVPTDTSIIGIDQDASDTNGNKSFTFGTDASTPNGTYTVLVGGEDVNTAASATMDFTKSIEINPVPSPVPASQPVTLTAVAKLNGTENASYNSAITWSADGGTITPDAENPAQATFTAAAAGTYTVTATLGDVSNTTSVVVGEGQPTGFTVSGTVSPVFYAEGVEDLNAATVVTVNLKTSVLGNVLKTTVANNQTGEFSFSDVANGTYVLEFKRDGFLTRFSSVNVSGSDVANISKELYPGDFYCDYVIDSTDMTNLFSVFGSSYGDGLYNSKYDVYTDGVIDSTDTTNVFAYFGNDVTAYNEAVNYDQ